MGFKHHGSYKIIRSSGSSVIRSSVYGYMIERLSECTVIGFCGFSVIV